MSSEHHINDDVVTALIDGGLGANGERVARAHVATCTACRARYDEHALLRRALASASFDVATRAEDEGIARRALAQTHPAPHVARSSSFTRAIAFAGVAAAACIALFVVVSRPGASAPVLAATVLHAKGATVGGAALVDGAPLLSGATLDVSPTGLVELNLVRGGTLRVFPDSTLTLTPRGEHVQLAHGKVWAIVDAGRGPFQVTTSEGSARVLGTSFLVENRDAVTDVKVVEGRVEVRSASVGRDAPVVVNGGERTRVAHGEHASAPRRYDAHDDRDQWQRFVDDLLQAMQQMADDVLKALDPSHKR